MRHESVVRDVRQIALLSQPQATRHAEIVAIDGILREELGLSILRDSTL